MEPGNPQGYRDGAASPMGGLVMNAHDIAQMIALASREAAAAAAREVAQAYQIAAERRETWGPQSMAGTMEKMHLPKFSGTENVIIWLDKCENTLEQMGPLDIGSVRRATTHLDGAAWAWYSSLKRDAEDGRYPFDSWKDFREKIVREFRPQNANMALRRQLRGLNQTGSVSDYTRQFREIVVQIVDMSAADQVNHYTAGLRKDTACEVEYQNPGTLQEAILVAQAYDDTHYGIRRAYPRMMRSRGVGAGAGPEEHGDPMELGYAQQKTGIKCFKCGERGHMKRDCPGRQQSHGHDDRDGMEKTVIEMNAVGSKAGTQVMRANGVVGAGKMEAVFMFDSGATHNFVSMKTAKDMGLPMGILEGDRSVKFGDGKKSPALGLVQDVVFRVGDCDDKDDFVVIPGNGEDLVLGMGWLERRNPTIDWRQRSVMVDDKKIGLQQTSIEYSGMIMMGMGMCGCTQGGVDPSVENCDENGRGVTASTSCWDPDKSNCMRERGQVAKRRGIGTEMKGKRGTASVWLTDSSAFIQSSGKGGLKAE
jgi:hypothetical protein